MVSGGARGVTAKCVIKLAAAFKCAFILLGRSSATGAEPPWANGRMDESSLKQGAIDHMRDSGEKPTPKAVQRLASDIAARREINETLRAIEAAGGRAAYHSADVRDPAALKAILDRREFGPVTGLIHGAGQIADKLIESKTTDDFESVYNTKVAGLENLLSCVPAKQLKHLVLFSSAAGYYGNAGQTDYAIANEILNKIAHQVTAIHPDCRAIAIDWCPWEGGMVTPEVKALFEKRGISVIPYDEGAQLLVNELASGTAPAQIVVGSAFTSPASVPPSDTPRKHVVRRIIREAGNPFLADHRIGNHAVLPTVCAVAWIANTAEQLYPGLSLYRCEKFKVLKGIVFDDSLAGEYRTDLEEVETPDRDAIAFRAMVSSVGPNGLKRPHYSGVFSFRAKPPEAEFVSLEPFTTANAEMPDAAKLYTNGTLFHGPSFQGVKRILSITRERLVIECRAPILSEEKQGQFLTQSNNPFAADVLFQSFLIWVRKYHDAGSLPLATEYGELFHPIGFGELFYVTLDVEASTGAFLIASLTAVNAKGQVCIRLRGAQVTISRALNALFAAKS